MKTSRVLLLVGFAALSSLAAASAGCGDDTSQSSDGATETGAGGATSTTHATGTNSTSSTMDTTTGTGGAGQGGGGTGGEATSGPIDAPDETWTFVPFPTALCMNDTSTGIGINKTAASDDVIIYLAGGNACFNTISCAITANLMGYGPAEFQGEVDGLNATPLFSRATSVLKDYNFVYVPYCTGDVHAGNKDATVGGQMRTFRGAVNMDAYLERVVATFPNAHNVILSGSSAGGFGAAFNYDRVSKAFGSGVNVMLLDDSGPPMGAPFVPACLQQLFMNTWGLDTTLPAECTGCLPADGAFLEPYVNYITSTYPASKLGLISSTEDGTISSFLGFGNNDCANVENPGAYDGSMYAAGLQDLRDRILGPSPNFKMFLIDGTNGMDKTHHVWLNQDPTTVMSNDVSLETWLEDFLAGSASWENVPASGI